PRAWRYLVEHADALDGRRSAIYKNRPRFCLFGIGEYAFKPYKVAIAGFYKDPSFSLVLPAGGRPVMLDDTCYYLAFDGLEDAVCALAALNSPPACAFLGAITFRDGKRVYTKEALSRVNLAPLLGQPGFEARLARTLSAISPKLPRPVPTESVLEACRGLLRAWANGTA
ncbi:MAG: SAM-dependent methyltransferase, partial [Candidatus Lokiarchaeota archaeon]|nr:SAM-dependent methyltransferase [Candidatus Lokiarchaeota archaeon]